MGRTLSQATDMIVRVVARSQVLIEVAPDDELEPEDGDLVNELTRRTEAVGGARFLDAASAHSQEPAAKRLRTDPPAS